MAHSNLVNFIHTFEREVEAAKPVTCQGVCSTLKHNGRGSVDLHHFRHYRLEYHLIGFIVDAITQRKIDSIVLAPFSTNILFVNGKGRQHCQ